MPYFQFDGISIVGISAAVPKQVISVDSFSDVFGEEVIGKYKAMTGIYQFHKTMPEQTASDLGFVAARNLLQEKNIALDSIGALLFVTQSPDYRRPATACVLHKRLGLSTNCVAYDINLGCSGYIYGLQTICSLMQSSDIENALLIVAETSTKAMWPKDQSVSMMFGDSGCATLLKKEKDAGKIRAGLWSKGEGYRAIIIPAGAARDPDASREPFIGSDGNEHMLHYQVMSGTDVFQFSISDVPQSVSEFLAHFQLDMADFDCYGIHQANAFIVKQFMRKFKLPKDKVPMSIGSYGNTGGVSIPLTLCHQYGDSGESNKLKLFLCGFGIGLSWGAAALELAPADILSICETDDHFEEGVMSKDMF